MIKYIMAILIIGIIAYGGWFLYQDDTIEEVISIPITFQEE
jgi:hypothetical protein